MRARPALCVTVTAPTMRELRARRDAATEADLVELRLDTVSDPDVASALADRQRPVVITCRPSWEGGSFQGSEEERHRLLQQAIDLGADFVDVEWRARFDDLIARRAGRGIVVSSHEFGAIGSDPMDRYRAMRMTGAEVVKLSIAASCLTDTLQLLEIGTIAREREAVALIGMGAAGLPTRILAAHFGSCWTYAGELAGVGQLEPRRLLREFRFRSVTRDTAIYGIVGRPAVHSVSPAMHNGGFDTLGLDAVYVPFEAADADDFGRFARALGVRGASVTAPFKRDFSAWLSEVDEVSLRTGALNTVKIDRDSWIGRNTDVAGFVAPLAARTSLRGQRAAVLGAGGSARSAALALRDAGARVTVHSRHLERAVETADAIGGTAAALPPKPGSWDLLVNATPVGSFPHVDESPMAGQPLDGRLVYDLVYNPMRTRLLADAEAAGCQVLGGLPMLVGQACLQFDWWTGHKPDSTLFERAASARLDDMWRTGMQEMKP